MTIRASSPGPAAVPLTGPPDVQASETRSAQPTGRPHDTGDAELVGVWLHGARGSVATTAITGLLGLRENLLPPIGCVTERPPFDEVRLPVWSRMVVGGHDITGDPIDKRAEALVASGVVPHAIYRAVRPGFGEVEAELRPGYDPAVQRGPQREAVERMAADIEDFRARHGLDRVVVINVASTEPPTPPSPQTADLAALDEALGDASQRVLRPSSVAALAAFRSGSGFVDFTPSTGARLPALAQAAREHGVPYAGSDGKTGETLLRSVLAPMFASRALHVLSWTGTNLLGGGDGATLADTETAHSKLRSKSGVLPSVLGEDVTAPLHIDYVPDLGDHKTAWDHVSFEGFLGVRMTMQLIWQGVDSALAAPLVLDLARLVAAAHAAGHVGPVRELAYFFKDPIDQDVHAFARQDLLLARWAESLPRRSG
ncbi:inositol-3-phosphate synthase [Actinomadura syzygii]|uniref:Myo-inositol-1-phosphate synthase n=1 Tax=Actinomadura syzygii TaxID=1427538 RepID=A0A5D0TXJ7_9ACTN|nr:inositol-3-phosphate synthase [Actinomadura syzygii]TYC10353.1 myo-inositol-1-phosphate synthase [Actinomadura syzygii]